MRETLQPTVYLLGSHRQGTLYLGMTSNLLGRLWQHRNDALEGFTKHYGVKRLLWFEQHATMHAAITREKQIKRWRRAWKIELIEAGNPDWKDLALEFGFEAVPSLWTVSAGDGFPRSRE